jgi:murein DD-endopeptidase MepM/ murein hydrolase activator NlpD
VLVDDIEVILATIRQLESAGRYDIGPNRARASGAYQFIPSTWNNYGGYAEAYLAPPAVQDERARADVHRFLSMYGGDVSMVPVMWYYPRAALDPSWMDRVPNPSGGNRLTIREYQTRWLEQLAANATALLGTYVPAPSTPAAVSVLSEIPEHVVPAAEESVTSPAPSGPPTVPAATAPTATAPNVDAATVPAAVAGDVATDAEAAPPVVIDVDVVTVSETTMDLAARSVPPANVEEDGLGSMRTIVFPVLGPVAYANGWGDPRSGGRAHEGTDIVGVRMQPILAAVDGVISRYQPTSTGIRGVAVSIADVDGWRYNYFHNNDDTPGTDDGQAVDDFRLAPGLELGDNVIAGQIIGYMGDSGNAEESVAHLHFELRDPSGRARPSYWSLRAAEARQACTIGIGPWSTPTVGEVAVDDVTNDGIDAADAVAVPSVVTDPPVAGVLPQPATLTPPLDQPGTTAEPGATVQPVEQIVEHTVVTPMYGEGQWVIDSEGRVTATGDAALIMPRRDLQCDVGPATPFGTESAGWDEVDHTVLEGTVLEEADLTGTVLDHVVPDPPLAVIPELSALAARVTTKLPVAVEGPPVDDAISMVESISSSAPGGSVVVDSDDVTVDGESVSDDPISQPMAFTDPATGETIIVVFELPRARPDLIIDRGLR